MGKVDLGEWNEAFALILAVHTHEWVWCSSNATAVCFLTDLLTESSRNFIHAENAVSHFISCESFFIVVTADGAHQKAGLEKHSFSKSLFYGSYQAVIFQKSVNSIRNFPALPTQPFSTIWFFSLRLLLLRWLLGFAALKETNENC